MKQFEILSKVTDVENAILEGADGVMLSEETAIGKYPVEAVAMMEKIISYTETQKGMPDLPFWNGLSV